MRREGRAGGKAARMRRGGRERGGAGRGGRGGRENCSKVAIDAQYQKQSGALTTATPGEGPRLEAQ